MADESTTNATADSSTAAAHWKGTSRYELLGCLGQGGMGLVYDVFDRQRQERIALKILVHFDASNLYRFKQEFRTLADVLHPNLVHLHELVADERDAVFFTMELIEGTDFLGYVHKAGTPRVADRTQVVEIESGIHRARPPSGAPETAEGLEPSPADFEKLRGALCQLVEGVRALHAAGKLHRDLKPSNVRVTREGRTVILDFGVATELRRRTRADGGEEEIVGTVTYMAPEQASGEAPVAASDWYSVGAMLYEALVGRPPFSGSAIEVLTLKYTVTPTPPRECVGGVPPELNDLCMALLAPDAEQRPTGVEILRRLGATTSDRAPAPQLADRPEATRLVGREGQLRALKEAFDASGAGRSVAVRIAGLAGLGKSAVVHHFLDGLEQDATVLVLRGRVYQRESMPYKAVDSVVDALSRHLMDLQAREGTLTLPRDIWALSHVFPVLQRVHSIEDAPKASIGDPQVIRQLAFDALRELFATLTKRQRVVVFIDDVQWGDTDSAALLVELMRSPGAPGLLLVTTHRTDEAEASAFLSDLSSRWPEDAEVRELTVEPLKADDSVRLALALLGSEDARARQTAEGIARESGGNPFLLEELARSASGYHRVGVGTAAASAGAVFSIEQILGQRLERLPDDARRLLEVVAVGGRPLPVSSVGEAASTEESATQLVALLRARRFVRAGLRDGRDVVEVSHDRIRDTIVGQLAPETVRGHHAQLARVLAASPDSDPEAIASHLLGAGDKDRAAVFAERAAEHAVSKLAFAQAARLYQVTCDTLAPGSPDGRRLKRRLAEACEWAGYAERAARAYLAAAADGAPEVERIELEGLATAQLIAAGCVDESAARIRRVLAAVGRKVPDTLFATMFWVTVFRIASMFLMGRKLRDGADLSLETTVRLNALHAFGRGLSLIEPFVAMYIRARNLVDALRSGSRSHVIRAAAAEAGGLGAGGGRVSRREHMLFEMSRKLTSESKDGAGYALYRITYGVCEYLRGRWRSSVTILDETAAMLVQARRWHANASVFSLYSLVYMGDLREVKSRATQLVADAERRGDLYTVVNLRASHPIMAWLATDDVTGARKQIRESMSKWSKTGFLVQHWQSMLQESECDLYMGEGVSAWERFSNRAREIEKSHLLELQLILILTHFVRGRAAIASLAALPDAARGRRLKEAKRLRRLLERERLPWPVALGAILSACVANVEGDRRRAEGALRSAIELATIAEMFLHAEAARHQLGTLLGGQQGATMVSEAAEAMKARGVRVPERYAQMLVPGPWRPVSA
jgi:eukaryotic-like serine/threonine-protein kinase